MNKKRIIRNVSATLLLICIFLPLSKCTKTIVEVDSDQNVSSPAEIKFEHSYFVPVNEIKLTDISSYLFFLPFAWPFPFWIIQKKMKNKIAGFIFTIIEAGLLGLSTYLINLWIYICGSPYWGGFLALMSLATLWAIFLIQLFNNFKELKIKTI